MRSLGLRGLLETVIGDPQPALPRLPPHLARTLVSTKTCVISVQVVITLLHALGRYEPTLSFQRVHTSHEHYTSLSPSLVVPLVLK